jgi:peptidoglycan/xylan/chitin deacetylase (PgdA/CDA1 family)
MRIFYVMFARILQWFVVGPTLYGTDLLDIAEMRKRRIVLTFDDGPREEALPGILAVLDNAGVRGTFFVEGSAVQANQDLVRNIVRSGHDVANHSYSHTRFVAGAKRHGITWVFQEVDQCSNVIYAATGMRPTFIRPPYWSIREDIFRALVQKGYHTQLLDNRRLPTRIRALRDVNTADYLYVKIFGNKRATSCIVRHVREAIALRERQGIYTHVLVFHELPAVSAALHSLFFDWTGTYEFVTLNTLVNGVSSNRSAEALHERRQ